MKTLALLLSLFVVQAAVCRAQGAATFDSPGGGLKAFIEQLKSGTNGPAAPAVAGAPLPAPAPIVLTIAGLDHDKIGLGIELGDLERLLRWALHEKQPDPQLIADILAEMRRLHHQHGPDILGPDDYLQNAVRAIGQRDHLPYEVEDFAWARDAKQTDASVQRLELRLLTLSYSAKGRPLYIVGHSWGSVLAHEALTRLAEAGYPVPVTRLITIGSPLAPTRTVVRLFKDYHVLMDRLHKGVTKPRGVEQWINFWAKDDPFSGPIKAADHDIQVDTRVPAEAALIKEALAAGAPRKAVAKDLAALTNGLSWHMAYIFGFHADLASIHEDVSWDVPQEIVEAVTP